jgi:hypothetical protein
VTLASGGNPYVHDHVLRTVLALPRVRPEAVNRGRLLLGSRGWCRADEVAAELVACLVERRIP